MNPTVQWREFMKEWKPKHLGGFSSGRVTMLKPQFFDLLHAVAGG